MSQKYSASKIYANEEEVEVQVSSSKCQYFVWINEDEITLRGPGVRESSDTDSLPRTGGRLDDEDFAILVVLLFENGLWPKE